MSTLQNEKSSHRNLIIIGNGFDLSSHLPSGFSEYINNDTKKKQIQQIESFINMYQDYSNKLSQFVGAHKIYLNIADKDKNNFLATKWAKNYFNIKLLFYKQYWIKGSIDYKLNPFTMSKYNKKINQMGESFFSKLCNCVNKIKLNNFWILLVVFQDIYSNKFTIKLHNNLNKVLKKRLNKKDATIQHILDKIFKDKDHKMLRYVLNSINDSDRNDIDEDIYEIHLRRHDSKGTSFSNWCDVENTIKYFLIAIRDLPTRYDNNFKGVNHYFRKVPAFFMNCFESYVYLNIYLNSLKYVLDDYFFGENRYMNFGEKYMNSSHNVYEYIIHEHFVSYHEYIKRVLLPFNYLYLDDNLNIYPLAFLIQSHLHEIFNNHTLFDNYSLFTPKFLNDQLTSFEKDFTQYLMTLIGMNNDGSDTDKTKEYENTSFKLLNSINDVVNKISSTTGNKFEVLDFNYTPLKGKFDREHIHGSLSNRNIIIGAGDAEIYNLIDKTNHIIAELSDKQLNNGSQDNHDISRRVNILTNDNNYYHGLLHLSKAYRILKSRPNTDKDVFSYKNFQNVDNIVFFGHSLGINDYPYFEAIFDKLKLYNSDVNLIFCYTKFTKRDKSYKRKYEQIPNITGLINLYGHTLNNKYHGRNMFTKLLISGRIRFCDVSKCVDKVCGLKD